MTPDARAAAFVALLASVVACSRTPPEPTPATTADSTATKSATVATASTPPIADGKDAAPMTEPAPTAKSDAGRCMTKLAAQAPTIPPVASLDVCPKDPTGIPKSRSATLTFPETPKTPKVDVEIAESEKEITRGLMYRRSMPEEHGMLFNLEERRDHTFWMHNTCMPLDMLFVDEDGFIVGIVESAQPLTDSSRSVGCDSRYVLEVNAGWCRRHAVEPGQKLAIPASVRPTTGR